MLTLASDLHFPEGPRWHEGALYFSDFYRHSVFRMAANGELECVAEVAEQPSGLGWLPDGRMLIVSMLNRRVLRQERDGKIELHADLNAYAAWHCNDMIVDRSGRAYIGNFGFDSHGGAEPKGADLIAVEPDGKARVVASDLMFPNGTVITPDGRTLIIGETRANRLTAFTIDSAGGLSERREWASLGIHFPDGICLDADGCIWVADPRNSCVLRVAQGGRIERKIDLSLGAFACTLGGVDGRTLYVCAAKGSGDVARAERSGCILAMDVDVPACVPASP
jgi:sugar lactone lactonase YvrE